VSLTFQPGRLASRQTQFGEACRDNVLELGYDAARRRVLIKTAAVGQPDQAILLHLNLTLLSQSKVTQRGSRTGLALSDYFQTRLWRDG
jgi:hypothetical protein